ncbi:MAG: DUF4430 domain-containing protein [Oscillospiraceae bacterium]|nr:DUF4430 domain-containing protein [Oscillospiraceae bacterium]
MKTIRLTALLLALLLSLTGCGDATSATGSEEAGQEKTITLTVTYADGSEDSFSVTTTADDLKTAAETVVSLEGYESALGYTITAVNGERADFESGDSAYWAVYINGEYGLYSIDAQPIADGDLCALIYESF